MASKNSRKNYSDDSYYHIYNRGVEKRLIFQDDQDYAVFLSYLKIYLLPKDEDSLRQQLFDPLITYKQKQKVLSEIKLNNFNGEITLLAYCLMPNHFHFLIKQKSGNSIDKFMNSLCVRYAMYFNHKYKRVGKLFQDVYKAVVIETEFQLLHLTSYIHRNPLKIFHFHKSKLATKDLVFRACFSKPSSLPEYLGQRSTGWINTEEILSYFSKTNPQLSYQSFVEQTEDPTPVQSLVLDL